MIAVDIDIDVCFPRTYTVWLAEVCRGASWFWWNYRQQEWACYCVYTTVLQKPLKDHPCIKHQPNVSWSMVVYICTWHCYSTNTVFLYVWLYTAVCRELYNYAQWRFIQRFLPFLSKGFRELLGMWPMHGINLKIYHLTQIIVHMHAASEWLSIPPVHACLVYWCA